MAEFRSVNEVIRSISAKCSLTGSTGMKDGETSVNQNESVNENDSLLIQVCSKISLDCGTLDFNPR